MNHLLARVAIAMRLELVISWWIFTHQWPLSVFTQLEHGKKWLVSLSGGYIDTLWVLGLVLVQWHVPVSGWLLPQCPHRGEVILFCHPVPLTRLQSFLGFGGSVFLPLFAAVVVLFPLLAGWRGTVGVVVMETVGQAFAVFKFSPVVITVSGWPPRSYCRLVHC